MRGVCWRWTGLCLDWALDSPRDVYGVVGRGDGDGEKEEGDAALSIKAAGAPKVWMICQHRELVLFRCCWDVWVLRVCKQVD